MEENEQIFILPHKVDALIKHIKSHWDSHVVYNSNLIDIYNGALLPFVEKSMKIELNPRAFDRSKERIPPVNVLNKLVVKTSKVYAEAPIRSIIENDINQELLDFYQEGWDINEQLQYANDLLVINKYCALEPYIDNGEPGMRVLSAKDFLVYSDSRVTPNKMTVFIKFAGTYQKQIQGTGTVEQGFKEVALFHAYSDEEFMIFDEQGDVLAIEVNPHGVIPFCYIRSNSNELIPTPDSDNLPMTVLIPKLLADLNYAVMFGCRSQVVGIDVEMGNVEWSPDSIWILNSMPGENKNPSLDTIKSDVDVDKVLNLINNELGLWLDTKGIKSSTVGKVTVENAASGISKLIDESDATAVNRRYMKIFRGVERCIWKLVKTMHNTWINNGELDMKIDFSEDFKPSVELIEAKPIVNTLDVLEELKLQKEIGIFLPEKALKKVYPDATQEEIDEMLEQLNRDSELVVSFPPSEEE